MSLDLDPEPGAMDAGTSGGGVGAKLQASDSTSISTVARHC